jgi:hypothetical protein
MRVRLCLEPASGSENILIKLILTEKYKTCKHSSIVGSDNKFNSLLRILGRLLMSIGDLCNRGNKCLLSSMFAFTILQGHILAIFFQSQDDASFVYLRNLLRPYQLPIHPFSFRHHLVVFVIRSLSADAPLPELPHVSASVIHVKTAFSVLFQVMDLPLVELPVRISDLAVAN